MSMESLSPAVSPNRIAGEGRFQEPAKSLVKAFLDVRFERDPATGNTYLVHNEQTPPLRLVRSFAREDGSALAHLHNVSGGILGGDELTHRVSVGRGANVQLTTTGATRIYRSRTGSAPASQTNEIAIAEDGMLEYVPDAIIPFSGSRFCQRSRIRLEPRAGLFWWEILAPGREARGETFEYEDVELNTYVSSASRLIAAERLRIEPGQRDPRSIARLGSFRYLASFLICRAGIGAEVWKAAEQHLRDTVRAIGPAQEALWGISTLPADGLAVRGLGRRGRDVQYGLQTIWRTAKLFLYGTPPILPRKVN
jgi:urease accessory protein